MIALILVGLSTACAQEAPAAVPLEDVPVTVSALEEVSERIEDTAEVIADIAAEERVPLASTSSAETAAAVAVAVERRTEERLEAVAVARAEAQNAALVQQIASAGPTP